MERKKSERLKELFRRLGSLPRAASFDEARKQEMWQRDGRMYPVGDDNIKAEPNHPWVKRLRSFAHNIYISSNGAMEFRTVGSSEVIFSKPGVDEKGVWEQ